MGTILYHISELWGVSTYIFLDEDADYNVLAATTLGRGATEDSQCSTWRLVAFVVSLIVTCVVGATYSISLPIILGREVVALCSLPVVHDVYTFVAGSYIVAAGIALLRMMYTNLEASSLNALRHCLFGFTGLSSCSHLRLYGLL